MSPVGSRPRPEPRHPEPDSPAPRGLASEREQWELVHAAYPLNRGIPHAVDFPAGAR